MTKETQKQNTERPKRKRGRRADSGRASRVKKRLSEKPSIAVWPGVESNWFRPLDDPAMESVHAAALDVLADTGVGDATEELLEIALAKGCHVNEHGRLCFPASLIEDLIAGASREYVVYARGERAGNDDMYCNGNRVHFSTAGSAVTTFVSDSKTYRASNILDIYDFTRLTDRLDNIHMCGDTVVATDLTEDFTHDINVAYALLAGTEKPFCMSFRNRDYIKPAIEMFDLVLGGDGRFLDKPFCVFGGCPIVSPLKFGRENLEVLIETSRLNLVSDIAIAPQSGATAPAPLAGILVQVIAETLACLAVVNMVRSGCGMTFAAWPFITDLRTGSFSGGSGEQALLAAAAVQMGKFYNLPNSVGAGMTDSKIPDAQSGFEKGISLTLAALAGCNRICEAAGMMGSLMGCSFESLVIDNEILGAVLRSARGIEVNDETLSVDVIKKSTIDPGHFLGNEQTLKYMESEYLYPKLSDRDPTVFWEQQGSKDMHEKSREIVNEILSRHYPNYIGEAADRAVRSRFPIAINGADMQPTSDRWPISEEE